MSPARNQISSASRASSRREEEMCEDVAMRARAWSVRHQNELAVCVHLVDEAYTLRRLGWSKGDEE